MRRAVQIGFPQRPPNEAALVRSRLQSPRRGRTARATFPAAAFHTDTLDGAAVAWNSGAKEPDNCGFLRLDSNYSAVVLADVAGDTLSPVAFWTALNTALRSADSALLDPTKVVSAANERLNQVAPQGWYATLFLGLHDRRMRRLSYANCAHTPPALLRADGSIDALNPTGSPLGLSRNLHCQTFEVDLETGDWLLGISDGFMRSRMRDGEKLLPRSMAAWARDLDDLETPALALAIAHRAAGLVPLPKRASLNILVARGV